MDLILSIWDFLSQLLFDVETFPVPPSDIETETEPSPG